MKKGYPIGHEIEKILADDNCNKIRLICTDKSGIPQITGSVENKCTNKGAKKEQDLTIFRARNKTEKNQKNLVPQDGTGGQKCLTWSSNEPKEDPGNWGPQSGGQTENRVFLPGPGQTSDNKTEENYENFAPQFEADGLGLFPEMGQHAPETTKGPDHKQLKKYGNMNYFT